MTQVSGPRYKRLPLWRDAMRLLLAVETAVRRFPRYHKYTLGSELRRQCMDVCRFVARAAQANNAQRRAALVEQLVWEVEDLKIQLQLAKEVQAFGAFSEFQRTAELAVAVGKQSGGWWKRTRSAAQASSQPRRART